MVSRSSLLVLVVLGIFSAQMLQTESVPLNDELLSVFADRVMNLWRSDIVEFLGYSCRYSVKPTFKRWELKFNGKFWCPGWASFSGNSLRSSDSSAVENAIKDFIRKCLARNLVARDEVEDWL